MGVVITESIACGRVNCLRVRICAVKKNHVKEGSEGQPTGARQKRCDRPLLLRVSASFASSEAMFFVLYGQFRSTVGLAGQTLTRRERVW